MDSGVVNLRRASVPTAQQGNFRPIISCPRLKRICGQQGVAPPAYLIVWNLVSRFSMQAEQRHIHCMILIPIINSLLLGQPYPKKNNTPRQPKRTSRRRKTPTRNHITTMPSNHPKLDWPIRTPLGPIHALLQHPIQHCNPNRQGRLHHSPQTRRHPIHRTAHALLCPQSGHKIPYPTLHAGIPNPRRCRHHAQKLCHARRPPPQHDRHWPLTLHPQRNPPLPHLDIPNIQPARSPPLTFRTAEPCRLRAR